MSDSQYKTCRSSYQIAEANYAPDIPNGLIEMFNRKFKEWEKRRGLEIKSPFTNVKRGITLRNQKATENKSKAEAEANSKAKVEPKVKLKAKTKSPAKSKKKK